MSSTRACRGLAAAPPDQSDRDQARPGGDLLAGLCRQWEEAAESATALGIRVVRLRTGVVLGRAGGALGPMLPLFRLGLGGKFGHGRQWWSWVSMTDQVGAIAHLLTAPVSGPVNITGPAPTTISGRRWGGVDRRSVGARYG